MSLYYRTSDARVIDVDPSVVSALSAPKRATLRQYSVDAPPVPTAVQYVVEGPVVVDATTARQTWELRAKPADQIAVEQFLAQQQATLEQARALYSALKNGSGTASERLVRVERVCAHYLRDRLGSEPT